MGTIDSHLQDGCLTINAANKYDFRRQLIDKYGYDKYENDIKKFGLDNIYYSYAESKFNDVNVKSKASKDTIKVESMRVSCRSDKIPKNGKPKEDMVGLILYSHNGLTKWKKNGVKCRSGYIIIKKVSNIDHLSSGIGRVHGKLYKYLFNEEPKSEYNNTVGAGFGYKNGEWAFRSKFNKGASYDKKVIKYHDGSRKMSDNEIKCVCYALHRWIKYGQRDTNVADIPKDCDESWI